MLLHVIFLSMLCSVMMDTKQCYFYFVIYVMLCYVMIFNSSIIFCNI